MKLDIATIYPYVAMGFGGLFLVPQIFHGYKRGSLKDLSSLTLGFVSVGSALWGFYMYEQNLKIYMYATGFLFLNANILLGMQVYQYYGRFKEHVRTFEPAPAPAPTPAQNIIQLEVKEPKVSPDNGTEIENVI
jgi:uncharacterized protein with PQ loop repeat